MVRFANPAIGKIKELDRLELNERQKKTIEFLKAKKIITNKDYR